MSENRNDTRETVRTEQQARPHNTRALRRTVLPLLLIVGGMTGLSFAAVPLYDLFCRVTGYGGTTQVADAGSTEVLDRKITIRFDANISPKLDWNFKPAQTSMDVKIGESALAVYEAHNPTDKPLAGTATYNVTPEIAGYYFSKVQCFCFTEQTLEPGRRMDMPVSFFVDPAIMDDPEAREIEEITLSYTFFPMKGETQTGAAEGRSEKRIAAAQ
ncbi:cytochrome c oxidase assembly protein [Dichotomicrobium thermohalophilum]|uniref:Cytochrome c oxidase assembly protein CtaG n=1 Tax=Dichotomicrobium thermohalophilum TaxID=933063 RepID=A0A397Q5X7_9HYPH|nr:cytochrome c oxidase assembly protein [Dichotomicrobium thermohalophilum]RIA55869.1 cytochrome c oxidase assembly protein subunit 11 [Dichotomicrobium thermohalophilum]